MLQAGFRTNILSSGAITQLLKELEHYMVQKMMQETITPCNLDLQPGIHTLLHPQ